MDEKVYLTFRELIERRAADNADKTFCAFGDRRVSFAELKRRVDEYAAALRGTGIVPGDRVGLMLPNCLEHIYLFFALAWLGAIAVPISIHLKREGLSTQLASSKPRKIVAEASYAELVKALPDHPSIEGVLWRNGLPDRGTVLDRQLEHLLEEADHRAPHEWVQTLDQPCAISYTSGTTGEPKGAILTQRWFQVGAKNAGVLADAHADSVLFLWEPFFHVAGWMTVLMSLQHAATVAMVERFSASQCWDQMRQFGATHFHYLGGAMNLLLKQPRHADDASNPVRVAWGAAAPAQSWREFEERFGLVVREGYGITEAGNFTMINLEGLVGSVGKPVEEFHASIEDDEGRPVPDGVVGEIVLHPISAGITMLGYFGQSEKTAEVLRAGSVYSGDLGYRDAAGNYFFTGRKKDALRRRGENVSAWEVERVVNQHPEVEESAVIGVPSDMGEQDIKVFIRKVVDSKMEPQDVLTWCEDKLAYYQLPRYVEFVVDFPRGPTQRIRKMDLPVSVEGSWDLEKFGRANASRI